MRSRQNQARSQRERSASLLGALMLVVSFCFLSATSGKAQSPLVAIETVPVGDAGNLADTNGYGSVAYDYRIAKFEVTISQYVAFLNAVASAQGSRSPTIWGAVTQLWHIAMQQEANVAGVARSGSGSAQDPYVYSVMGEGARPVAFVSWFAAARFANWINNGATSSSDTESGAYELNGMSSGNTGITRTPTARWWIPNENEWYKAAYYKGGGTNTGYWLYPTSSDQAPGNTLGDLANQANYKVGGTFSATQSSSYLSSANYLSPIGAFKASSAPYGTFDQAGNLREWLEATFISPSNYSYAAWRGGDWNSLAQELRSSARDGGDAHFIGSQIGFRLAGASQPKNLLTNGSFEQPDVLTGATKSTDGWITYGNGYSVNGPSDGFKGWSVTSGEIDVQTWREDIEADYQAWKKANNK